MINNASAEQLDSLLMLDRKSEKIKKLENNEEIESEENEEEEEEEGEENDVEKDGSGEEINEENIGITDAFNLNKEILTNNLFDNKNIENEDNLVVKINNILNKTINEEIEGLDRFLIKDLLNKSREELNINDNLIENKKEETIMDINKGNNEIDKTKIILKLENLIETTIQPYEEEENFLRNISNKIEEENFDNNLINEEINNLNIAKIIDNNKIETTTEIKIEKIETTEEATKTAIEIPTTKTSELDEKPEQTTETTTEKGGKTSETTELLIPETNIKTTEEPLKTTLEKTTITKLKAEELQTENKILETTIPNNNSETNFFENEGIVVVERCQPKVDVDAIRVAAAKYLGFPLTEFSLGEDIRQKLQFQQTFKTGYALRKAESELFRQDRETRKDAAKVIIIFTNNPNIFNEIMLEHKLNEIKDFKIFIASIIDIKTNNSNFDENNVFRWVVLKRVKLLIFLKPEGQKELPQLRESILTEAERARACSRIGDEAFNGQRRNGPSTNQQNIGKISNGGAFALAENRDRLNNNIGESNDNNFGAEAFLQQRLKGNENTQIEEEFNNKMSQNSKQDEQDISINGEQALLFNNAAAFKIPSLINADELDVFDPLENSKPNSQIRRPFTEVTINSITTPSFPISRYRPILVKVELPVAIAQRLRPTPSIEFFFEFNNEEEQQQNKQLLKSNSMLEMINKIKKINREEAEKIVCPPLDILFIVDSSGSVHKIYEAQKEWLQHLLENIELNDDLNENNKINLNQLCGHRVALIQFASVRHITGTTYIGQALKQALKLLEERRRQVPIIVILLSDGFSQDDAIKQAEAIRKLPNLQFYALSIGELSNIELLHRLVDNPSHVFIGNEASELLRSQLLRRIRCNK
uniref:VWFA domain-containing protein n=1 Tax=Meloidogyne javanica TaxID=6303 RepID=A0A915MHK3_MELJA